MVISKAGHHDVGVGATIDSTICKGCSVNVMLDGLEDIPCTACPGWDSHGAIPDVLDPMLSVKV